MRDSVHEDPLHAEATAWGGRDGRTKSSDGTLDLTLTLPKGLGGPGGDGTNPEQLFAAGYASCFHSALKLTASSDGRSTEGSAVTAKVSIGATDSGGFGLEVELEVLLPQLERAEAEDAVAKAHEVCPYSNATRGNIDVTLTVVDD